MTYAVVTGRSWASVQHAAYEGRIVFEVAPLTPSGTPAGASFLAVDAVGACPGQRVLVAREGNAARQVLEAPTSPYHAVIVGIVDALQEGPP